MLDAVVMQMPVWEGETCQNVWHNLRARADRVHSSKMEVKHQQNNPSGPTSFLQGQANQPRPVSEATVAEAGLTTGCIPSCLPSESTGKRKAQPRLQQALTKHWERDLMS